MQKLKQYWVIITLIIIMIGAGFYWLQWRPSQIRKTCTKQAMDEAKKTYKIKAEIDISLKQAADKDFYLKSDFDYDYKICLSSKGIE